MSIDWPPILSWTRTTPLDGFNHFVAINYGGVGKGRWLNLVSVLDGKVTTHVCWDEINDNFTWLSGWSKSNDMKIIDHSKKKNARSKGDRKVTSTCLHPSMDSGFQIPTKTTSIRPWN
tara:strand:- start:67 stop:420 length:354 start_codon:yes stop_codon:yes gene_type:complete